MSKKSFLGSIALTLLGLALACVLLETGAMAYQYAVNGQLPSKADLQATLDEASGNETRDTLSAEDTSPAWMRDHVLHPYLGFVLNRDKAHHVFNRRLVNEPVNRFGFFGNLPPKEADPSRLVVGVFGGSVATELYLHGGDMLRKRIAELPLAAGKTIDLVSVALGGMKQPQQLLALNYLLVNGHHFDIVVNVDGFNEVALPFAENMPFGIAASYPRSWRLYSAKSVPAEATQIAAEAHVCQDKLAARRAFFSRDGIRESWFALALWETINRRTGGECHELEMALRDVMDHKQALGFQEKGPVEDTDTRDTLFDRAVVLWETASLQMWKLCEANNIRYLHILQPNQYVEDSKTFTQLEQEIAIAQPTHPYRMGAEHGYPLLREAGVRLADNGVPYHDLTLLFHDEPRSIYKDKCCHVNQHGNDMLAARIAELIGSMPPISQPDI